MLTKYYYDEQTDTITTIDDLKEDFDFAMKTEQGRIEYDLTETTTFQEYIKNRVAWNIVPLFTNVYADNDGNIYHELCYPFDGSCIDFDEYIKRKGLYRIL